MTKSAYTLLETMQEIGISRSMLYKEIKSGKIPVRKIGNRSVILGSDLHRYLQGLPIANSENQA